MSTNSRTVYRIGRLVIDDRTREVSRNGVPVHLAPKEFEVLSQLLQHSEETVPRDEFTSWPKEFYQHPERHPVEKIVIPLKRKFERELKIILDRGVGYRLVPKFPLIKVASPVSPNAARLTGIALSRILMHTRRSIVTGVKKCEQALSTDPSSLDALIGAALGYINKGCVGFGLEAPRSSIPKARKYIEKALEVDPRSASAFALRGLTYLIFDYKWTEANADMMHALEVDPKNSFAHLFLAHLHISQGKIDSGLEHAQIAKQSDSARPITAASYPRLLMFAGHLDDAMNAINSVIDDFDPFPLAHQVRGRIFEELRNIPAAITDYKEALRSEFFPETASSLAHAYAKQGNRSWVQTCLRKLEADVKKQKLAQVSGYDEALVAIGLGDSPRALKCLEAAYEQKCDWLIQMGVEPRWEGLRKNSRFKDLLQLVVPSIDLEGKQR